MERSSSVISHQQRLVSKNHKWCTPQIYHAESKYALEKQKGHLPSYLSYKGTYQKTIKGVPPNLPCWVQVRTWKMERSSSVISWQWRLISENHKRRTPPNFWCQLKVCNQTKLQTAITLKQRLVLKNRKRWTPPNFWCWVKLCWQWREKHERWQENCWKCQFVSFNWVVTVDAQSKYAGKGRKSASDGRKSVNKNIYKIENLLQLKCLWFSSTDHTI